MKAHYFLVGFSRSRNQHTLAALAHTHTHEQTGFKLQNVFSGELGISACDLVKRFLCYFIFFFLFVVVDVVVVAIDVACVAATDAVLAVKYSIFVISSMQCHYDKLLSLSQWHVFSR